MANSYQTILVDRKNGVAELTLNRPEKMNALNYRLQQEFSDALLAADEDAQIGAIIVTGAGRAFCAGIDLTEMAASLGMDGTTPADAGLRPFQILDEISKPVIGAVNGFAVTGGLEIALGCDILIASRSARFADTHALVGVMPGGGLSQKLSRVIGLPRAMAISLTGEYISAERAYQYGLISHLLDDEELMPTARNLAQAIVQADSAVVLALKSVMKQGARMPLGQALQLEREAHAKWRETNDIEAVQANLGRVMERGRSQV